MAEKLTRLTHKIAIQLHLVAESCTILQFSLQVASPETSRYTLVVRCCTILNNRTYLLSLF
jgi:hypothetical protein